MKSIEKEIKSLFGDVLEELGMELTDVLKDVKKTFDNKAEEKLKEILNIDEIDDSSVVGLTFLIDGTKEEKIATAKEIAGIYENVIKNNPLGLFNGEVSLMGTVVKEDDLEKESTGEDEDGIDPETLAAARDMRDEWVQEIKEDGVLELLQNYKGIFEIKDVDDVLVEDAFSDIKEILSEDAKVLVAPFYDEDLSEPVISVFIVVEPPKDVVMSGIVKGGVSEEK